MSDPRSLANEVLSHAPGSHQAFHCGAEVGTISLSPTCPNCAGAGARERPWPSSVTTPGPQALLAALSNGPGYALDLIERVKRDSGNIEFGQDIYPMLRDLEANNTLESYEGNPLPERHGRARRYYRIATGTS